MLGIADRVRSLDATSSWELEREDFLDFDAHHVQGLARVDEAFFISSVDVERRRGLVFEVAPDFALRAEIPMGDERSYHPGGMDEADGYLWVPVAPYEPSGPTLVQRVSVSTRRVETVFVVDDHLGAAACLPNGEVIAWSWGSRGLSRWNQDGELLAWRSNPSHFVDWQDVQVVGPTHVVCGGRSVLPTTGADHQIRLGGLAVLETTRLEIEHEVHFPGYSPSGLPASAQAFVATVDDDALRLTTFPDGGTGPIMTWCCHR